MVDRLRDHLAYACMYVCRWRAASLEACGHPPPQSPVQPTPLTHLSTCQQQYMPSEHASECSTSSAPTMLPWRTRSDALLFPPCMSPYLFPAPSVFSPSCPTSLSLSRPQSLSTRPPSLSPSLPPSPLLSHPPSLLLSHRLSSPPSLCLSLFPCSPLSLLPSSSPLSLLPCLPACLLACLPLSLLPPLSPHLNSTSHTYLLASRLLLHLLASPGHLKHW